jgi:osmotically inducible protein OsmC
MKTVYTTRATSIGGGRSGSAASEDGRLSVALSIPKEMGGDGGAGTNPEQLFAAGYAACFVGAFRGAARKLKVSVPDDLAVTATVRFLDREDGVGYSIGASLEVSAPGLEFATLEQVMQLAHDICPYSHLIRNAHDVELKAVAEAA